jgi:hypothetical protein
MQNSVFNNPMFGAGLAELVKAYIGDPEQEMRMQSQQLDNRYRELQIAQLEGKLGGGSLGDLVRGSMGGGGGSGGGGGGRSGGPAAPGKNGRDLTQSEMDRITKAVTDAGFKGVDGALVRDRIISEYQGNSDYVMLDQALAKVLPNVKYEPGEVIDSNDSWINPLDWVTGPELGPDKLIMPPSSVPAPVGQPDAGGIPVITDPSQLQALPPGTRFKAPDGSIRIKP